MTSPNDNNLWLFLEALARRRGLIFTLVFLATIAAVAIALLLPPWFEATALLLPPKNVTLPMGGLSQLSDVASVIEGLNLPVMVTPSDVYAKMLTSRTVAQPIIDRFNLSQRYETPTNLDAYLTLMAHSRFVVTPEGLLLIGVEDRNPDTAAALANAFVEGLDRLNRGIASDRASQNRGFIEDRVGQIKTTLDSARQELENFQMEHRTVDFDQQTRLAIEEAIALKVELSRLDIDLRMMELSFGKDNPDLVEKRSRRDIVQHELDKLESGGPDSSFFSLPIASVPTLRSQYGVIFSQVKVHEQLYSILLNQLEQAKLSENEDLPTVSVLDYARTPEIRSRPRRTLIVGATFLVSLFLAIMLALVLEYFRRLAERSPEDYARASFVINAFLGWIPFFRVRSK